MLIATLVGFWLVDDDLKKHVLWNRLPCTYLRLLTRMHFCSVGGTGDCCSSSMLAGWLRNCYFVVLCPVGAYGCQLASCALVLPARPVRLQL